MILVKDVVLLSGSFESSAYDASVPPEELDTILIVDPEIDP